MPIKVYNCMLFICALKIHKIFFHESWYLFLASIERKLMNVIIFFRYVIEAFEKCAKDIFWRNCLIACNNLGGVNFNPERNLNLRFQVQYLVLKFNALSEGFWPTKTSSTFTVHSKPYLSILLRLAATQTFLSLLILRS